MAFRMYGQLSFSTSWCERIMFFRSSSITIPGPWVPGPPRKVRIRAPVLGNAASNSPTAIDNAVPHERSARLPCGTGHGSGDSSDSSEVSDAEQLSTDWMNLQCNKNIPSACRTSSASSSRESWVQQLAHLFWGRLPGVAAPTGGPGLRFTAPLLPNPNMLFMKGRGRNQQKAIIQLVNTRAHHTRAQLRQTQKNQTTVLNQCEMSQIIEEKETGFSSHPDSDSHTKLTWRCCKPRTNKSRKHNEETMQKRWW